MAKFYGKLGFAVQKETEPGVWTEDIEFRPYKGDVLRNSRRWDSSGEVNDNFNINNSISVIADTYLYSHFPAIRCVEYLGALFKVTNADIERPRVLLNLGGVFNGTTGPETEASQDSEEDAGD